MSGAPQGYMGGVSLLPIPSVSQPIIAMHGGAPAGAAPAAESDEDFLKRHTAFLEKLGINEGFKLKYKDDINTELIKEFIKELETCKTGAGTVLGSCPNVVKVYRLLLKDEISKSSGGIFSSISAAVAPVASSAAPAAPVAPLARPITPPEPTETIQYDKDFYEKQQSKGCGRHALNNLLGGAYFIKSGNDEVTDESVKTLKAPIALQPVCEWLKKKDIVGDCPENENYDINVLQAGLNVLSYPVEIVTMDDLQYNKDIVGYIVNFGASHWVALRNRDKFNDTSDDGNNFKYINSIGHESLPTKGEVTSLNNFKERYQRIVKGVIKVSAKKEFDFLSVINGLKKSQGEEDEKSLKFGELKNLLINIYLELYAGDAIENNVNIVNAMKYINLADSPEQLVELLKVYQYNGLFEYNSTVHDEVSTTEHIAAIEKIVSDKGQIDTKTKGNAFKYIEEFKNIGGVEPALEPAAEPAVEPANPLKDAFLAFENEDNLVPKLETLNTEVNKIDDVNLKAFKNFHTANYKALIDSLIGFGDAVDNIVGFLKIDSEPLKLRENLRKAYIAKIKENNKAQKGGSIKHFRRTVKKIKVTKKSKQSRRR
jgi:hypothetical protein